VQSVPRFIIYALVFLGAALMVFNIVGFIRFAFSIRNRIAFKGKSGILYVPIFLLVFFLFGYLAVGLFGNPDLIVAGILFFGSVFVCIVYYLISGITKRILENEEIEARLIASEESNNAKMSFLASISHEMRTPMNVILGLDDIVLRDPDLSGETRRQLEKIRLSARHLQGLINNILDMNRIETGSLKTRNEVFELSETIAQVNAIVQTVCDEKGLLFLRDAQEAASGRFIGDEMQLKQVLMSILDNAVKYTDAPGSIELRVEPGPETEETRAVRFRISDTGVGMDKTFLSNIFNVFTQEDASSTNRFGGSGLSLAVTKSIVDQMGGDITVESQKYVGSTFTVTIPLRCAPAEETVPEEAGDPVSLEGRRVLIAEDIPENAEIVQDLLELEGVETEHAENGAIALECFRNSEPGHFDAILMDLRMPVMDGFEATRSIRALPRTDAKTVPIIALTANAFESDVQASLDSGMNEHLAKPADSVLLYAALRRLIGNNVQAEEKA